MQSKDKDSKQDKDSNIKYCCPCCYRFGGSYLFAVNIVDTVNILWHVVLIVWLLVSIGRATSRYDQEQLFYLYENHPTSPGTIKFNIGTLSWLAVVILVLNAANVLPRFIISFMYKAQKQQTYDYWNILIKVRSVIFLFLVPLIVSLCLLVADFHDTSTIVICAVTSAVATIWLCMLVYRKSQATDNNNNSLDKTDITFAHRGGLCLAFVPIVFYGRNFILFDSGVEKADPHYELFVAVNFMFFLGLLIPMIPEFVCTTPNNSDAKSIKPDSKSKYMKVALFLYFANLFVVGILLCILWMSHYDTFWHTFPVSPACSSISKYLPNYADHSQENAMTIDCDNPHLLDASYNGYSSLDLYRFCGSSASAVLAVSSLMYGVYYLVHEHVKGNKSACAKWSLHITVILIVLYLFIIPFAVVFSATHELSQMEDQPEHLQQYKYSVGALCSFAFLFVLSIFFSDVVWAFRDKDSDAKGRNWYMGVSNIVQSVSICCIGTCVLALAW